MTLRDILNDTEVRIITDKSERYNEMVENLNNSGIVFGGTEWVHAEMIPDNPSLGCNMSQIKATTNPPSKSYLLVLEDDVEFHPNFSPHILDFTLPNFLVERWSAIYLGISNWGNNNGISVLGGVKYEPADIESGVFVRVNNMFSTHAILYLNNYYIGEVRNGVQKRSFPVYIEPNDLSNAESQVNNYCTALRTPMFYQKGPHEYCTKIEFKDER